MSKVNVHGKTPRSDTPDQQLSHSIAPQQSRSQRSLHRILDAAEGILREHGPQQLTIPNVAERAETSVGNIYRRFQGKQDLLRAIKDRLLLRLEAAMSTARGPTPGSIEIVISNFVDLFVAEMRRDASLYALILSSQGADLYMNKRGAEAIDTSYSIFRKATDPFLEDISHIDPDQALHMSFIVLVSCITRRITRSDAQSEDISWETFGKELKLLIMGYLRGSFEGHSE